MSKDDIQSIDAILKELNGKSLLTIVASAQSLLAERGHDGYVRLLRYLTNMKDGTVTITLLDRHPSVLEVSITGLGWVGAGYTVENISKETQHAGIPMAVEIMDMSSMDIVGMTIVLRTVPQVLIDGFPIGKQLTLEDALHVLNPTPEP